MKAEEFIDSFINIPFLGYAEKYGWEAFYIEVIRLCKEEAIDLVYFHHFHKGKSIQLTPKHCIEEILQLPKRPVVITSVGDPFSENWMMPDYPEYFKDASKLADITFSSQMGKAADKMIKWGAKNVVLSPLGMCQKRFKAYTRDVNASREFEIVFIGNSGLSGKINPISKIWWSGKKRVNVVKELHHQFKEKFGLYGEGWDKKYSQGAINFDLQQETFNKGRFAIDAPPRSFSDYYSSNRHLFQIASGAPTIMFETPRIKNIYKENDHCYYVEETEKLIDRIEEILKIKDDELRQRANNAAKYIQENHTQYHRMRFKIDTVKRFIANNYTLDVKFPFFLPEVNLDEEMKFATRTK
ncbi:MAG: glycosyltransferase [Salinivirgaceae bacterium]